MPIGINSKGEIVGPPGAPAATPAPVWTEHARHSTPEPSCHLCRELAAGGGSVKQAGFIDPRDATIKELVTEVERLAGVLWKKPAMLRHAEQLLARLRAEGRIS